MPHGPTLSQGQELSLTIYINIKRDEQTPAHECTILLGRVELLAAHGGFTDAIRIRVENQ